MVDEAEEVVDVVEEVADNNDDDPIYLPDADVDNLHEENEHDHDVRVDPIGDLVRTHRTFRNADFGNILYYYNGTNRYICQFCNARNFFAEKNNRLQGFSICCANGKVTLPEPRYDDVLKGYFLPNNQGTNLTNIRKNIRIQKVHPGIQQSSCLCFLEC